MALSLLAGAAVLALYALVVRTSWGQRLDEYAFSGRALVTGRPAEGADQLLSSISVGTLILAVAAVSALALLRRRPRLALLPIVVVVGSQLATQLLKLELLTRPALQPSAALDNTYPSGHTTVAISVGLAAVLVVPPRLRAVAAIGAALLAAAVGIATVAAGWHRPSDVVGAYFVSVAVAAAAAAVMLRWLAPSTPSATGGPGVLPGWVRRIGADELALAALVAGAAGLLLLAVLRAEGIPWTSAGIGFLLSAAAIAASAVVSVAALTAALNRADRPGQPP